MMKLYHRLDCPFCWKVNIFLHEVGADVDETVVTLGQAHPDVVALNPNAKVPVLINGDMVLYESAIIIEYLTDKFPESSLMAGTPEERAAIRQLQNYSDTKIGKILFPFIKKVRESKDASAEEIEGFRQSIAQDWQDLQNKLSGKLADKEFFTSHFSVAECALIPRMGLAVGYGLKFGKENKNLADWFDRVLRRPSFLSTRPMGFPALEAMVK